MRALLYGGGYWEGQGVCIANDPESPWGIRGDLLGYVAELLSTIRCLEGQCEAGGGGCYEGSVYGKGMVGPIHGFLRLYNLRPYSRRFPLTPRPPTTGQREPEAT
jgi:hypothetical protein